MAASFSFPGDTDCSIQPERSTHYGVPVINAPVTVKAQTGGGTSTLPSYDAQTFRYGEPRVPVIWVSTRSAVFTATVGGISRGIRWLCPPEPGDRQGGVEVVAFSRKPRSGPRLVHHNLWTYLADATQVFSTDYLPVSLSAVSVSFDGGGFSLPGRLYFVSPGQVNVQVPWSFRGTRRLHEGQLYGQRLLFAK